MVRIWRVEDVEGWGPYKQWDDTHKALGCNLSEGYASPRWPMHGSVSNWDSSIRFAFASKADLLAWFDPEALRKLAKLGYKVRSYLVEQDRIIPGNKQIAYKVDR